MSLHQLIDALLSESPETPAWQTALQRLVNHLLTKRQIARRQRGTTLSGVYKELYDALKDELLTRVQEMALSDNPSRQLRVDQLLAALRKASQTVITYECLNQLALALQRQTPKSAARQYALAELFGAVLVSDKLRKPSWAHQHNVVYEDILNDALEYAVKKIDSFDPEKAHFAGWINKICLERRGRNTVLQENDSLMKGYLKRITSIKSRLSSVIRNREIEPTKCYFSYYIRTLELPQNHSDYLQISIALWILRNLMETDYKLVMELLKNMAIESIDRSVELQSMDVPFEYQNGDSRPSDIPDKSEFVSSPPWTEFLIHCLKSCNQKGCNPVLEEHVKNYPQVTFREIAIQRAQETKWRDIAEDFGIPVPTLSAHYGRRIDKVLPALKQCVDDQEELWKMQKGS